MYYTAKAVLCAGWGSVIVQKVAHTYSVPLCKMRYSGVPTEQLISASVLWLRYVHSPRATLVWTMILLSSSLSISKHCSLTVIVCVFFLVLLPFLDKF